MLSCMSTGIKPRQYVILPSPELRVFVEFRHKMRTSNLLQLCMKFSKMIFLSKMLFLLLRMCFDKHTVLFSQLIFLSHINKTIEAQITTQSHCKYNVTENDNTDVYFLLYALKTSCIIFSVFLESVLYINNNFK